MKRQNSIRPARYRFHEGRHDKQVLDAVAEGGCLAVWRSIETQLKDQEENARRRVAYDKAKTVRDELADELADLYPAFAQKLSDHLRRRGREVFRDGQPIAVAVLRLMTSSSLVGCLTGSGADCIGDSKAG